ncbi:hypothetical protein UPYG_G00069900 [Umbra pygmaea]|uniref:glycogenin glucosyltransferase n=1 Tax=Umbra pygmaea TaxID=75934 RepID=A0ABD0XBC1_UMBPY
MSKDQAFVTLATNDNYARGAMVLGTSLRNRNTTRQLVVMIGPKVSDPSKSVLEKIFDEVRLVDVLDSGDSAHLALMKRPELGVTFTKLHCWTLTHYSKCVFMDADTLVLQNIDELFDRGELSASPDPGWPDCFNSGVFVFQPSNETYGKLLEYCTEHGSFDGGDQGILNGYFSNWATADISKHLPFIYNLSSIAIYTYLPAFKQYGSNAKVVHFLGKNKPWNYTYDPKTSSVSGDGQEASMQSSFLLSWWSLYSGSVVPVLTAGHGDQPFESGCVEFVKDGGDHGPVNDCCSQTSSHMGAGWKAASSPHPPEPCMSSEERKQKWEQGQADYMGLDSFVNIEKKLDAFLK